MPSLPDPRTVPPQVPRPSPPRTATGPLVSALVESVRRGDPSAADDFWRTAGTRGTPLVEEAPGEPGHRIVTFLWRGEAPDVLVMVNKVTDPSVLDASLMERVEGTDIWHRGYVMRSDWRATYRLAPGDPLAPETDGPVALRMISAGSPAPRAAIRRWSQGLANAVPDPLNRRASQDGSVVELPDAPPDIWSAPRDVPKGTLTERRFASAILGDERTVWTYEPPVHSEGVLVLLDGEEWAESGWIATVLDNLIAAGAVPPLRAIMPGNVDTATRVRELACHEPFTRFLTEELVPRGSGPAIIGGASLGGLTAAYAAYLAPDRFDRVISLSGSFWWPNAAAPGAEPAWLTRELARCPRLPVRFHLDVGSQEWALLAPTRHLRDVLAARGYEHDYHEYNGGHDALCWRVALPEALRRITRDHPERTAEA
ncbi:enterochelin esterase [Microtetraspora sp. AC03309]|uniref:enterochelin esterase n=1 Tax=Microtetraspora sp. AC03309 TaxID=2779376 RepID=UPI001E647DED|nr:enterochelin esterase [Microtetraspora sp. AC03309]MCC5578411.1 enterochelin esterase [Microtetraspora sp. AC03309]